MFLAEDGAARVGGIGYNQTGSPLINHAFQMLQINLPGLLRLQIKETTHAFTGSFEQNIPQKKKYFEISSVSLLYKQPEIHQLCNVLAKSEPI